VPGNVDLLATEETLARINWNKERKPAGRAWASKPPTAKQLAYLGKLAAELGTTYLTEGLTRGDAALMLDRARRQRREKRRPRRARRKGRRVAPARVTYADGRTVMRKPGAFARREAG
jgi:hypothetical protein